MSMHVITVTKQRSNVTIYNKGGYLYLNFMLDAKRKRKALKMIDTPQNRKVVQKEIIPQLQKKIALGEYGQEKKEPKTFKFYSDFFLEHKEKTIKTFLNKLHMYKKVIKFFENDNVKDINRLKIKQYISSLEGTSETKADYLAVIREVLNYALDDEEIANNPTIGITVTKERRETKIDFFTKEEVSTLLSDKRDEELNRYLLIALNTGARPEEVIALKYTDFKNGFIYFDRVKTKGHIDNIMKTSGSKRVVPCNIDPIDLKDSNSRSFELFPNIRDVESFRKRWASLLKRNNIAHRGISICRHTFATHLLRDGIVSINELSGLLGHSRVSTTLNKYASVIDSKDTQVAKKMLGINYNQCHHSVTQDNSKENLRFG